MTDNTNNNQRYDDTYSPVFDIEERSNSRETSPLEPLPEQPAEPAPRTDKGRPRTVKPVRRRQKVKEQAPPRQPAKPSASPQARPQVSLGGVWQRIKDALTSQTCHWLVGLFIGGFAIYLLVAFISYFTNCIADQAAISNTPVGGLPPVGNAGGEGGARLSELLINESFGLGSFVIIVWLVAVALKLLCGRPRFKTVNFSIKCLVALITVSLIIGLLTVSLDTVVNWGGYHGRYVNEFIIGFAGWSGAVILCLFLVATFFVICLRDFVNWVLRKRAQLAEKRRQAAEEKAARLRRDREVEQMRYQERLDAIRAGDEKGTEEPDEDESIVTFSASDSAMDSTIRAYDIEDEEPGESAMSGAAASRLPLQGGPAVSPVGSPAVSPVASPGEGGIGYEASPAPPRTADTVQPAPSADSMSRPEPSYAPAASSPSQDIPAAPASPAAPATPAPPADEADPIDEGEKEDDLGMVVNVNTISQTDKKTLQDNRTSAAPQGGSIKHLYKFPSPLLLREGEQKVSVDVEEQQANKDRIRETLKYHGIPITSIEATVGPTVTLYEIRPGHGIKISKIKNLADDIALSLAARGVRIIAPIPGRGTVGIEVANSEPQTVSMRSIIMSRKYNESHYKLPVAIGSTIGNDVYMADLTKMPHLLVAGATGQGKSVGLNAIIASLLYKKRPDELKFVMIDPKEVEFSLYAKIEQHYLAKLEDSDAIVTDMSKVVDTLNSLCVEMDNRYKLLRTAQVRNIEEYNGKLAQNLLREEDGHRFMPYIVLVVDEFADLIMTAGKEVETPIARLAQKARAIGIHVIIATQRPSTNVITGIIKANFPVRIAFKVSSGIDSKTILDATGAQALIGRGDMLISYNSEMVRVQCAFIDTPEVEAICEYIERQPFNAGPYILPEPLTAADGDGAGGAQMAGGERDPLFEEVAELVVTSGVGSTSGIQRRYSIGYNRAGKIMDQLEHYGVVGPSLGGKPRQVLMDMYGLQELLRTLG
ncbi:MAG: DNA translocase FtsK 4TM domain-containing protein [Muribaculaceae bacterium]|nr:DNA translocase FtsK 4TM domain-containing protein [Muribaculaceae bacterium]